MWTKILVKEWLIFFLQVFLHNSPNLEAAQTVIHSGNESVFVLIFIENYHAEITHSYIERRVNNSGTQHHKLHSLS